MNPTIKTLINNLLNDIVAKNDNISFCMSNGLFGLGFTCNIDQYREIKNSVEQFFNDNEFNNEDKNKYLNALEQGFMLNSPIVENI